MENYNTYGCKLYEKKMNKLEFERTRWPFYVFNGICVMVYGLMIIHYSTHSQIILHHLMKGMWIETVPWILGYYLLLGNIYPCWINYLLSILMKQ